MRFLEFDFGEQFRCAKADVFADPGYLAVCEALFSVTVEHPTERRIRDAGCLGGRAECRFGVLDLFVHRLGGHGVGVVHTDRLRSIWTDYKLCGPFKLHRSDLDQQLTEMAAGIYTAAVWHCSGAAAKHAVPVSYGYLPPRVHLD